MSQFSPLLARWVICNLTKPYEKTTNPSLQSRVRSRSHKAILHVPVDSANLIAEENEVEVISKQNKKGKWLCLSWEKLFLYRRTKSNTWSQRSLLPSLVVNKKDIKKTFQVSSTARPRQHPFRVRLETTRKSTK